MKPDKDLTLESFAEHFFKPLSVPFKKRESSHAPNGYYFSGDYENTVFCVYIGDLKGFEDMPFRISASSKNIDIETRVDTFLRNEFLSNGYKLIKFAPNNLPGETWVELK